MDSYLIVNQNPNPNPNPNSNPNPNYEAIDRLLSDRFRMEKTAKALYHLLKESPTVFADWSRACNTKADLSIGEKKKKKGEEEVMGEDELGGKKKCQNGLNLLPCEVIGRVWDHLHVPLGSNKQRLILGLGLG